MKPDLSLKNLNHGLCEAVERDGTICFNQIHCKGFCYKHYHRLWRFGSVNLPDRKVKKCKFIDCGEDYSAKGYCYNHYRQYMRRTTKHLCEAEGCTKPSIGKYCSMHRTRLKRYGSLDGSGRKKGGNFKPGNTYITPKEYKTCIAKECGRNSNDYKITRGLCPKHYRRWKLYGVYNTLP